MSLKHEEICWKRLVSEKKKGSQMARRIEGDLVIGARPRKPDFPEEWFDGTQWEVTWGWMAEIGEYDIPGSVGSPLQKLRHAAKRRGKKIRIHEISKSPWIYRIQAYCDSTVT